MNRSLYLFFALTIAALLGSCKLINPPEKIPSFIQVEHPVLITQNNEGTTSHNIVDAWVYINDRLVGVFEIPAKVPILLDGNQELKVFAGIKRNGLNGKRDRYPFYQAHSQSINLIPDSVITINPVFEYVPNAVFWIEDFEDPSVKFFQSAESDTNIIRTTLPSEVYEGAGSGKIALPSNFTRFKMETNETAFDPFPFNAPIFMEFDYKTNITFGVGIMHKDQSIGGFVTASPIVFVNPKSEWNKIYVDLTEVVNKFNQATDFEIYFSIDNPNTGISPQVFLDNIKVVWR
ncbi:MAG: hypothetical protein ACK4K0_10150 [Flavobacteriales bacterium]